MKKYAFCLIVLMFSSLHAVGEPKAVTMEKRDSYVAKDFSYLIGMKGFSKELLSMHFTLYQGYVKNTNLILQELQDLSSKGEGRSYDFGAIQRRLAWEFDGMRLHEIYFSNLGGMGDVSQGKAVIDEIKAQYGSFEAWKSDFINTGLMRGIGWVALYKDQVTGRLMNVWINEHDTGHLAQSSLLLLMDVWEHAFITEYGLNREKYILAFFDNIDWASVEQRFRG